MGRDVYKRQDQEEPEYSDHYDHNAELTEQISIAPVSYTHLDVYKRQLLSISIGMMLVVMVSTVGEIGSGLVEEEIQSLGVGSVTITANKTVADVPLTEEKLNTLREQPAVESASPIVMAYTQIELKGIVEQCAVWGIDSGSTQIVELDLLHGLSLIHIWCCAA